MSKTVVVYAEGSGELLGEREERVAPRDLLDDNELLGSAHFLVRRCVSRVAGLPEPAVRFMQGLATSTGRLPKGSDFRVKPPFLRLLSFLGEKKPDLIVVLVDRDAQPLPDHLRHPSALSVPHVIGIAVEEFESWLIADQRALQRVLRSDIDATSPVETLPRGEAKRRLADWCARSERNVDGRLLRRELAQQLGLDTLRGAAPAFADFLRTLKITLNP